MADYSDHYKDQQQEAFIIRWAPEGGYPEDWNYQTKWLCARARSAESELADIKKAITTLKKAVKGLYV